MSNAGIEAPPANPEAADSQPRTVTIKRHVRRRSPNFGFTPEHFQCVQYIQGLETLDGCENLLNELHAADAPNEAELDRMLAHASIINRKLRAIACTEHYVDRLMVKSKKLYHRLKARDKFLREQEAKRKAKDERKMAKLERMPPEYKQMILEDIEFRKKFDSPLSIEEQEKINTRYRSSPWTIEALRNRPKWDNDFPNSHMYWNHPLYDMRRSLYKYHYAEQKVPRRLAGLQRWEPNARPWTDLTRKPFCPDIL